VLRKIERRFLIAEAIFSQNMGVLVNVKAGEGHDIQSDFVRFVFVFARKGQGNPYTGTHSKRLIEQFYILGIFTVYFVRVNTSAAICPAEVSRLLAHAFVPVAGNGVTHFVSDYNGQ
jgi:hypothetical protein